ncbi:MAG: GNAT family N-acetyltransferase [Anaerolineae bacterium]|jgi:[ribosomal protein S5]-alanine N-acetyltransferase|nr:GNAT family N-acetyltransferase [Anaerolineae bacterium]MBT7072175.1 GNAT family N-acetyltransferase [Anaerolineae bacterium]MBT7324295.1 GNAT family N-acetyltransferase [Anaerolineae bacterium]
MDDLRLHTPRLSLMPLSKEELKWTLASPKTLEKNLGIRFDTSLIDENVIRAIGMKLPKMAKLPPEKHIWQTYWLTILREENIGIGLAGFKSSPNEAGISEIGYGIAPAYQNQGYMSEALRALVDWAFTQPDCLGVTATTVINPASNRILEKLGAALLSQDMQEKSWLIKKTS